MPQPATGATTLFGLRREKADQPGVPDTAQTRVWLRPAPPLSASLVRSLNASPEINSSGFRQRGVPGAITGAADAAWMLSPATLLEPLESMSGLLVKSEPETDVFQYVATPQRLGVDTSFDAILSLAPVEQQRLSMGKWSGLTVAGGNNQPLVARFAGLWGYDTHLSEADPDAGNTGTYTYGPDVRGHLRKPRDGEIVAIDITRDVAGGGLQYKAERIPSGGGAATFPGAAIDVAYDSDGNGTWQALVVAYQLTGTVTVGAGAAAVSGTGTLFTQELEAGKYLSIAGENRLIQSITDDDTLTLATNHTAGASGVRAYSLLEDAGYHDENYDPVEIIFPGTSSDGHDDADVGDRWDFAETWTDPTPTYISAPRFTSAHVRLYWRRTGATTWNEFQVDTFTWTFTRPVTPSQGTGSRHYYDVVRDGDLAVALQFVRKYTDDTFLELARSHETLEMRLEWNGEKMGTGAYRHQILLEADAAQVQTRTTPVAGPAAVQETVNISFASPDDGSAPVVVTVTTDRDYTVAA